jgi:hypothetical protein
VFRFVTGNMQNKDGFLLKRRQRPGHRGTTFLSMW